MTENEAATKIQRQFKTHSVSQDRKTGRLSQERKRWTPLFKGETNDGKIISVAGQQIRNIFTDIQIEQLWRNGKELHEFNLPKSLIQNEDFVQNLKKIILAHLESKTLRLAKAQIAKEVCEP